MRTVVKYLLLPSTLIALSAILGLVFFLFRSKRKLGIAFSVSAFVAYVLFASGPVSFLLLGQLEYQIPPSRTLDREGVHTIVVLAAYAESDEDVPLSSRVNSAAAIRLLEVLALYHHDPEASIIVSGGGAVPVIMRDVLVSAGVPADRIIVDADSFSTFESARHLAGRLGNSPFLLVTSAGHMPRAMGVFLKAGTDPLPVPTHFLSRRNWLAIGYLPNPSHLEYSDLAVSEYAAMVWYRINEWL